MSCDFNSISAILRQWEGDNERLRAMEPDLQRNHLASAQATKLSVRLGPFKIFDITFMGFTTSLLSNAKKHPSRAMKILLRSTVKSYISPKS